MRINVGDKVMFAGASQQQVNWGSNDDPRKTLTTGQVYTVLMVEVHDWHTKIELAEYPGQKFNSTSFEVQP